MASGASGGRWWAVATLPELQSRSRRAATVDRDRDSRAKTARDRRYGPSRSRSRAFSSRSRPNLAAAAARFRGRDRDRSARRDRDRDDEEQQGGGRHCAAFLIWFAGRWQAQPQHGPGAHTLMVAMPVPSKTAKMARGLRDSRRSRKPCAILQRPAVPGRVRDPSWRLAPLAPRRCRSSCLSRCSRFCWRARAVVSVEHCCGDM